jgi:predicted MFS family arabinose efflux permease
MNYDRNESATGERSGATRDSLFQHRDFLKLWAGETISDFGSRMGDVAISFAAVISLHATPFQMGLLSSTRIGPALIFSLMAGVWADRFRRRPILIAADLGRFVLLASIPIAAIFGVLRIGQLYAVILANAALGIFFSVAYRSYLPSLVEREQLLDANAKLEASSAVAEVGGFGLAGWLTQWLTAPFAILIDALSFVASAVAIFAIGRPEPEPSHKDRRASDEIREGWACVAGDPRLFAIAIASAAGALFYSFFSALYMIFVVNGLGFKPGALGMIFAVGGGSALFGALAAARTAQWLGAGRAMAVGLAINGAAMLLVPIARGATGVSVALLVAHQLIGDCAGTVYAINRTTIIQAIAPRRLIGRVNASLSFVGLAMSLLGALVGGWIGGVVGLRPTMVAGACSVAASAAILGFSPIWRMDQAELTGVADDPAAGTLPVSE